jgi:hypothetical protein
MNVETVIPQPGITRSWLHCGYESPGEEESSQTAPTEKDSIVDSASPLWAFLEPVLGSTCPIAPVESMGLGHEHLARKAVKALSGGACR